ncbi:hypothetical protein [Methylomonas rapida]|uniref:Uncharacterized protein n=1 Tax=Methylomonas rapida TaxID=2963939 RepID=A0ABY7GGN7_9GAMM|nr:hypothetical protein [Methylomonas rapida]WAR43621.1 hypothetical protein NM686_014700 [Methylomonas rapida]
MNEQIELLKIAAQMTATVMQDKSAASQAVVLEAQKGGDGRRPDYQADFGVAVMGFTFRSRWELETVGLLLGNQESVMTRIDREVRTGSCEYSAHQH